jgi:cation diffusion facilitator family transporter
MTELLLRIFVRKSDPEGYRSGVGRLSGSVGIAANVLLCAMKLLVGTVSGSVSITADAMNNLSDASSSIVTLLGFKLSEKPADDHHPYGHARYEYLSGLVVAALILVIGFELLKTSIDKILNPTPTEFSLWVALVLVGSVAMKLWLSRFNTILGRKIDSTTLLATAADSRNDVVSTTAVLLAAVVEAVSGWRIDGVMGLGVAVFILYSGITLGKETISPLLGENASPELRQQIIDILRSEKKVLGYHDLMVHDYGPGQRFASVHVEMDYREDPLKCHTRIDNLERRCLQQHRVHMVIHYDPIVVGDLELDAMRVRVEGILGTMDDRLSIHDFRMVKSDAHTKLIFDMTVPGDLMAQKNAIKETLDGKLNEDSPTSIYTVITFDPAF